MELKSCLKLDSDSEEDPEEVIELESEAEQPPLLRATNSSSPEFELVLGLLYPQTITAAERSGRAQVRKGGVISNRL